MSRTNPTSIRESKQQKKKLCIITTSRAEYGLLRPVIAEVLNSSLFDLQLIVSGTHLLRSKGYTVEEILLDEFPIFERVEIFDEAQDSQETSIPIIVGKSCEKFSKLFSKINPDLVLVLGDRFELLSIVLPAYLASIPIVHLCGGDLTLGAIDDSIRHAITKLSTFHFVNNHVSEKRVLQLGEPGHFVFNVGHTAIDNFDFLNLLSRGELETELKIQFQEKNILLTFHPVTCLEDFGISQLEHIFQVLANLPRIGIFITRPNIDPGHEQINLLIDQFLSNHKFTWVFDSLGTKKYFSLMQNVNLVLGNSSSGIMEAPYFKIPTVNVGEREGGRSKGNSVIDCNGDVESIKSALDQALCFSEKNIINPYGNGRAAKNIVLHLEKLILKDIPRKKTFVDLFMAEEKLKNE